MRGKEFAARIGFAAATSWRLLLCPGDDILYTTAVVLGAGAGSVADKVDRQAVIPDPKITISSEEEIQELENK